MKRLLFLCTGNYYRSRFAEAYVNHRASAAGISWRAASAGLARGITPARNDGPVSPLVLDALRRHGIEPSPTPRFPHSATEADLAGADYRLALYEPEHAPLIAAHFPKWTDRVAYLDIPDAPVEPPEQALPRLAETLDRLLADLGVEETTS